MQAPTIVVEIRVGWPLQWEANRPRHHAGGRPRPAPAGSLIAALGSAAPGSAWSAPVPAVQLTARLNAVTDAIRDLLRRSSRRRLAASDGAGGARRAARPSTWLDCSRGGIPVQPIMSYIPALSWSGSLRLARMSGDERSRQQGDRRDDSRSSTGVTPAIAEPYLLTSLAGHLAFADWGALHGNADADRAGAEGRGLHPAAGAGRARALRARRGPTTCSWRRACWRGSPPGPATSGTAAPPVGCSRRMPPTSSGPTACSSTRRKGPTPGGAAMASPRSA